MTAVKNLIRPWLTPYWLPVIQIALTGSVWTTIAVSVERYCTVCLSKRYNTVQHLCYTLPILGFSFVFNIPRFFELVTELVPVNETVVVNATTGEEANVTVYKPFLEPTDFRRNAQYSRDYVVIANSIALVVIPFFALIVLNSCIFRTINRATRLHNTISSHQRRDHKVAMMLITIVVVFVICHSIRSIVNIYECIQMAVYGDLKYWPSWVQTLVNINHFALVVNSSINILIYACKDEKFLNVLLITIKYKRTESCTLPTAEPVTRVDYVAGRTVANAGGGETINMDVMQDGGGGGIGRKGVNGSANGGGNGLKSAVRGIVNTNNGYCPSPKRDPLPTANGGTEEATRLLHRDSTEDA